MDKFIYFVGIVAICLFLKFLFDTYVKGERYDPQGRRINNNHTGDYDSPEKMIPIYMKSESVKRKMKYKYIKKLIDKGITAQELKKTIEHLKSKKYKEFEEWSYDDISDTLSHNQQNWTQEFYDNMGFMIAKSNETQGLKDFVCYYNGPDDFASEIGREKTLNWLNSSDSRLKYGLQFQVHYGKKYRQFGNDYIQSRVGGIYWIHVKYPNFISIEQLEYLINIAFELEGKTYPYLLEYNAKLCFERNNFSQAVDYYNLAISKTSKNEHYNLYSLYDELIKSYRETNSSTLSVEIANAEEKKKYHYNLWSKERDENSEIEDNELPF